MIPHITNYLVWTKGNSGWVHLPTRDSTIELIFRKASDKKTFFTCRQNLRTLPPPWFCWTNIYFLVFFRTGGRPPPLPFFIACLNFFQCTQGPRCAAGPGPQIPSRTRGPQHSSGALIDRLIDWSIDRLIDWSIDRLIDWSIDRLIDWSIDRLIDWSSL